MKDRSDDPSHHEQMLLPRSYISLLRKKRKTIDMDITALEKSAVGFADEAEKARGATGHSFIVKSSAMRRSAVEKKEELKALQAGRKEGNVLFKDTLNTFYLRLYGVIHMVKDHSESERGNLLPPHGLLFPISSKGSFICTIPHTGGFENSVLTPVICAATEMVCVCVGGGGWGVGGAVKEGLKNTLSEKKKTDSFNSSD